jgi:membrane protein DedA with SNARE-associated domain
MENLLELAEPWLYVLVFVLAAAEGAFLVGLVLPGESSMLLAGVVAYQGNASAILIYVCGICGAIVGDSIGYWVGRRFGPRLRASRLGRKVGDQRWERAGTYLRERGGRAVFLGRFAGFLRTLVPPVAGQAEMPYRRFVAFNVPAAFLWAITFISLGFAGGSSWQTIERWSGRASALVAALMVVLVVAVVVVRWLGRHKTTASSLWLRLLDAPLTRLWRRRFAPQIAFVRRRLDPGHPFGLYFSAGVVAALIAGAATAEWLDALREGDELVRLDRSVASFAAEQRTQGIDRLADVLTGTLNTPSFTIAALAVAAVAWRLSGRVVWLVYGAVAVAGATSLDDLVGLLLALTDMGSAGQFPSDEALSAIVLVGLIVSVAVVMRGWRATLWLGVAGALLMAVVGVTYAYEGALPSALAGGVLLGIMWIAICGATIAPSVVASNSDG